jgi:hypothetical protein
MSTINNANVKFVERFLWLISEKAKGKPTIFARMAGIPHSTLFGYVNGRFPTHEHLLRIRDTFNININWLVSGEGEPYMADVEEKQAAEPRHEYNLPDPGATAAPEPTASDIDIVLDLAKEVLSSGNRDAADALEKNIRYFAHSVRIEKRLTDMEGELQDLKTFLRRFGLGDEDRKKSGNG